MTTSIDSNVLVALWAKEETAHRSALMALDAALKIGELCVTAPVYAELIASPARDESFVNNFLRETGIPVEWDLGEEVWLSAGRAFRAYSVQRARHQKAYPRRILADFLIGAHANRRGYSLLTLDRKLYRAAFPHLRLAQI